MNQMKTKFRYFKNFEILKPNNITNVFFKKKQILNITRNTKKIWYRKIRNVNLLNSTNLRHHKKSPNSWRAPFVIILCKVLVFFKINHFSFLFQAAGVCVKAAKGPEYDGPHGYCDALPRLPGGLHHCTIIFWVHPP